MTEDIDSDDRTHMKYSQMSAVIVSGKIYAAPWHAARILEINPATSEVRFVGPDLSRRFISAMVKVGNDVVLVDEGGPGEVLLMHCPAASAVETLGGHMAMLAWEPQA